MSPLLDRAVARAVPPRERLDVRRWRPGPGADDAATRRRADAWIAAVGGEAVHARRLAAIGLEREQWYRSLADVAPVPDAPPAAWAVSGRRQLECLFAVEDAGGSSRDGHAALRRLALKELTAALPPRLERGEHALDGLLDLLASRLGAALEPSQQVEGQLQHGGSTSSWRTRIDRSPALVHLFGTLATDWLTASREMLARLQADRERLGDRFFGGRTPGRLLAVEAGLGDPHDGGRSVAVLTLDAGKLVYKPKDLRIVGVVDACARDLAAATGLDLDVPRIDARGGYAWQEFVPVRPLAAASDSGRFWRNLGGWLGLLQMFGAIDFWFDNLLADGPVPRFIDFETALQPQTDPTPSPGTRSDAFQAFALSALSVGILPWQFPIAEGVDPTDIGCLARPGDHRAPLARGRGGAGEPGGHLTWTETRFAPRRPDGEFADAAAGRDDFLAGYRAVLAAYGDAHLRGGLAAHIAAAGTAPVRCIRIDTWTCFRMIRRSLLPRHLADGVWREIALRGALGDRTDLAGHVLEAAVDDLRRLDVPLFLCPADGRDLLAVDGARMPGLFAASAVDHALSRLVRLGDAAVDEQVALARTAFAARTDATAPAPFRPADDDAPGTDALLSAADGIGQEIAAAAMTDPGGHATWIGLAQDVFTGVRGVFPLGPDLVNGRAGVALALLAIGRATSRPDLTALAADALAGAAAALHARPDFMAHMGTGIAGAGGVIYALARCGSITADTRFVHLAEALAALVEDGRHWRGQGDDHAAGRMGLVACIGAAGLVGVATSRLLATLAAATPADLGPGRRYAPSAMPVLRRLHPAPAAGGDEGADGSLASLDALWDIGRRRVPATTLRHAARLIAAKRTEGTWFPDHMAADRHHLSAVMGLSALGIALADLGSDLVPTGPRHLPDH